MLSGWVVKLFLLKFSDCSEDRQLRSWGSIPSKRSQSLRSRATKEVNPKNDSGNKKLLTTDSGCMAIEDKMKESCKCHDLDGRPLHHERVRLFRNVKLEMIVGLEKFL
ncbi:hypothetical protein I3760_16G014200 [Carya illinoinensis]|nr:hypothetical protein I3760_16G014200 [Carya illinoinensis]